MRYAYRLQGKHPFERPRQRQENSVKINLEKKWMWGEKIEVAQDSMQWWSVRNTVTKVYLQTNEFLSG
jgi:hypothetical protein